MRGSWWRSACTLPTSPTLSARWACIACVCSLHVSAWLTSSSLLHLHLPAVAGSSATPHRVSLPLAPPLVCRVACSNLRRLPGAPPSIWWTVVWICCQPCSAKTSVRFVAARVGCSSGSARHSAGSISLPQALAAPAGLCVLPSAHQPCPHFWTPHLSVRTADRYAVSVLWTLDAQTFEMQDVWFGRTLIRCAGLALQRGAMLQVCAAGQ